MDNLQWRRRPGRSRKALAQPWRLCCRSRASATSTAAVAVSSPGFERRIQTPWLPARRSGAGRCDPAVGPTVCCGSAGPCPVYRNSGRWARQDIHRGTGSSPPLIESAPGIVTRSLAREITMCPDSSGSLKTSNTLRSNSGSSSRNRTPWWARVISPGCGLEPPPTSAGT